MLEPSRALSAPPLPPSRISPARVILPLLIVASGIGLFYGSWLLRPRPTKRVEAARPATVRVAAARDYHGGVRLVADGVVVPFRELVVAAEVAGRIVEKTAACRPGRVVHQGETLLRIDPTDFQLEIDQLKRQIEQALLEVAKVDVELKNGEAMINIARKDLELQSREVVRLRDLVAQKIVTDSDLDKSRSLELRAQNALQTVENSQRVWSAQRASLIAGIGLAEKRLEQAELNLRRTTITASLDGVVVEEMVEQDSYVQRGAPLLRLEDTSAVEVRCNLRQDQLYWLWQHQNPDPNTQAEVGADSSGPSPISVMPDLNEQTDINMSVAEGDLPNQASLEASYELPDVPATVTYTLAGRRFLWEGRLSRYDGLGLDRRTRTVPCRVFVPRPRETRSSPAATAEGEAPAEQEKPPVLVRGMFVEIALLTHPPAKLIAIPRAALRLGDVVWKCREGVLEQVPVRVIQMTDAEATLEASPGLQNGDQVVVSPLVDPVDGERVMVEAEAAGEGASP